MRADNGAYVKSPGGAEGTGRPGGDFSTPDVDGGGRKAYDGAVFRSENVSRSVVRARVRLHGEREEGRMCTGWFVRH